VFVNNLENKDLVLYLFQVEISPVTLSYQSFIMIIIKSDL